MPGDRVLCGACRGTNVEERTLSWQCRRVTRSLRWWPKVLAPPALSRCDWKSTPEHALSQLRSRQLSTFASLASVLYRTSCEEPKSWWLLMVAPGQPQHAPARYSAFVCSPLQETELTWATARPAAGVLERAPPVRAVVWGEKAHVNKLLAFIHHTNASPRQLAISQQAENPTDDTRLAFFCPSPPTHVHVGTTDSVGLSYIHNLFVGILRKLA